jgi:cation transport regulator ChaB
MPKAQGRPDIPSTIARSDEHAQEIYQKAHDRAVQTYGEGEIAHRTAYSALKHSYKKVGDHWEPKAIKGPSDPQAARGPATDPNARENPLPTAGGRVVGADKPKDELYEEARKLGISGRSEMSKEELAEAIQAAKARRQER